MITNPFESVQKAFLDYLFTTYELTVEQSASLATTINDDQKKRSFGDLSSNAALIIAKIAGKNPRQIAEECAQNFSHPAVAQITIAGPGFINFTLTSEAFSLCAQSLLKDTKAFFRPTDLVAKNYSIEFVSANPTGPLHIGHGRGGIIGDVVGNVLRFLGHSVTKEFYINDAGKQLTTLGNSLSIRCQQQLGLPVEIPEDAYQGDYLVTMAQELITAQKARVENAIAQQDVTFFSSYAKEKLLKKIQETLSAYGVHFDVWFSEKTLHDSNAVTEALETLKKNGHTYEQEGALWFKSTHFGDDKDRVLRRSNGEVTYVAADVAYMQNKLARGAEKLILVLGQDHHGYVVRLKGIMAALGYNPDNLDVILYQLVTVKEDGEVVRLSKRAGRIVSLEDIIQTVGPDVARFFYLNRKADAHLDFDLALALKKTDENPVFYLHYAYVRTNSIFEKATDTKALEAPAAADLFNLDAEEQLLIKKIISLKQLLRSIEANNQAHLLTYYALELANTFHSFYAANRVIDLTNVEQSRRRLALVRIIHNTFALCFELLGISCPEKM
ncbi:MAG: Arginine-tRNA ligase [candidate division TM6 bacterium GW2011_GWE2_42_60]|nr:MAG: Arginine-tRNA ligase [candidate division TM6 bacterium GW2011_GWE2_42_60]HBY06222.1 arginine--tRNA ligase [Candidatus Dependentiae bacterium]